ncbi:hypothetical protein [Rheinheimera maricola]|uniref:DUF3109 family protein n=1 Tax=Rheinheimera maricola TaxID=2793282 RepID=A0ABS7X728_9GAMM|nr:hypothetical protein [Rheinheimera maricola]MBZ9610920.1 hypothetical protein [Rheinheimera maricola]
MKLQLFKFKCGQCGCQFKAPQIGSDSYGEFILRSVGNADEAYLDAMEDNTYQEVNSLLKSNLKMISKKPNELASILRKAYGVIACDLDKAGKPFFIGCFPKCPSCNMQEVEYWEATEPPEFIEKTICPVTHVAWSSLSDLEKQEKVDSVISSFGY